MIRKIKLKYDAFFTIYRFDINRIISAMKSHGYICTKEEAKHLWKEFSESMAAGWLGLPETDEEIVLNISPYFEPENESE